MFWGLTIEPGKHYSQTVDQSFHVSMAALDTREKSGITQLLVRHEKAEFLLCTLQYGDDIPYPYLQQTLNLNLSEGSEISFYSEGKGTIHLTGYLVTDEPIMEDPGLIAEARNLLVGSDEEEDYDSDDDDDDEEEEYSDSDMESTSSQDVSCNWQDLINDFEGEDDDDSEEEEWTPESAKKSAKKAVKEKKRKSQDDSISDDMTLSAYKKKRKAAVQAETLSKMEIAADEGGDEEDDEEEEEDGDFNPVLDMEAEESDDEDDEEDDEEDEEDYEEEEEEEKSKPSPKKKAQTPKGKEGKSPTASPQKASQKMEEAESEEKTESPLKKKKKKKKQQQEEVKEDESKEEVDLPLKNLKTNNKENIEVQKKAKPAKKEQTPAKQVHKIQKIKLQSGTTIEDLKTGEGKLAKPGKKVFMYYRGVLASNQKEFDSKLSGKPFMFGLGKGEVIKGWDAGIIGMKVGGKRRLTVPPSQAYGSQRIGPIPPNSTLIFDVELKAVR